MTTKILKQIAYVCLIAIALISTVSCSTNEEPMTESSNTELNTTQNKSLPDITYHPVYSKFTGTYYVRMFNGNTYTTPSKPRRVIVTYDAHWWDKLEIQTVNKTYTVTSTGFQIGALDDNKPLFMKFKLDRVTNNGVQYSTYNNLDQLVVEFLGRTHIVQSPNSNDLRFGKNNINNSSINAYFVRN